MAIVPATAAWIAAAAERIRAGRLVAFPTETVYGLGADATNGVAVAGIFAAKGRPRFNPLIVHVPDVAAAEQLADVAPLARRLAGAFWPGPLTLVLPRRPDCPISELATAGLDTVAVRVPDHPVAQALLAAARRPLAAPSANRSGHVSATTAAHVHADLGAAVDLILDGGPAAFGIESTVLAVIADRLVQLRPGAVTAEAIEAATGEAVDRSPPLGDGRTATTGDGDARPSPRSPGQLATHYAPRAAVRLGAKDAMPGEALLAFGPVAATHGGPMLNLSPTGDLVEAAANLFAALRRLDAEPVTAIAVMAIPEHGLGEAINDRLRRAAAPR